MRNLRRKERIVGLCTSGSFNVLGNDGRCSIIGKEIGFTNLGDGDVTSTHGNETSFELIVELNPDYMFVLDRDAAIGTEGAQLAQEIVENELIQGTDAYKTEILYILNIRQCGIQQKRCDRIRCDASGLGNSIA